MQELITQLVEKAGISADQASKVINVVKDFAKDKFPMLGGAVDNLFGGENKEKEGDSEGGFMNKVGDMLG